MVSELVMRAVRDHAIAITLVTVGLIVAVAGPFYVLFSDKLGANSITDSERLNYDLLLFSLGSDMVIVGSWIAVRKMAGDKLVYRIAKIALPIGFFLMSLMLGASILLCFLEPFLMTPYS